ncbi:MULTISPECIES: DUF6348 family protein [Kitasatospora]|uniref:Uncharacterized protein n=1 Tax=Kitasatospora setae (strain ATCC 33774 / DSM 43861 / JCM 3304 / KCC A-0304 / NBRC 14216 / KM-6054) TaxID=452652 RepID=E4N7J9_KITSK|nr:DUF6348 family protein [Kitasatospora setae]BAJ27180.1 hypothetical protein KSE_13510 [Kitasatospora setae KM-6054]
MADELSALHGESWRVEGEEVRGPGELAVRLGEIPAAVADGDPYRVDLLFLADRNRPETAVPDRVTLFEGGVGGGTGSDGGDQDPVRRAVEVWASTAGAALIELVAHNGRFAGHLDPADPDGLPGWHAIHGGVVGWGTGKRFHDVQDWLVRNPVLPALAEALGGDLGREQLVGVQVSFGAGGGESRAEVLVHGTPHPAASRALAGLDWPRVAEGDSHARTFVLLVRRAGARPPAEVGLRAAGRQ